ncbi:MAG: hypothetical protein ACP5H2_01590 [Solirubrobacteraceae bacterium]
MRIDNKVRNITIIVLLAALIYASRTAAFAYSFLTQLISLAFLAALGWVGSRLYMEHRIGLASLSTRNRALLYGAMGVAVLTLSATSRLWSSGVGTVGWLLLLGGCAWALLTVYRAVHEY